MIESPLIQEIEAKGKHEDIGLVLDGRFGAVPHELTTEIRDVNDQQKLRSLIKFAGTCKDLKAFHKRLRELK